MAKLSKAQIKAHREAVTFLSKDALTSDEQYFVLAHWRASANHINSALGAFFTPEGLARDLTIEASGRRIIDLCAGIGALSRALLDRYSRGRAPEVVCVEINPDYAAVGRKVVPEATWVVGDVLALPDLGRFDCAISNPPFGNIARAGVAQRYRGRAFEYHVIDAASGIANYGVFIIPQASASFRYSGQSHFEVARSDAYEAFARQTSIELTPNCGIDCSVYIDEWDGVAPKVEIVLADFEEARRLRAPQPDLFERVA